MSDLEKFRRRVEYDANEIGCWRWCGPSQSRGYGVLSLGKRKSVLAHRAAYAFEFGPIPDGMFVCHRCDNRWCVNPWHMFLGSALDNSRDMVRKGRHVPCRGERSGVAKVTSDDVLHIRRLWGAGMPLRQLGARFGISAREAGAIGRGERWAHISEAQ